MFGRRKDDLPEPGPAGAPEGQPDYVSIDDASNISAAGRANDSQGRRAGDAGGSGEHAQVTVLRTELEQANERLVRAMADFQNYQRRAGQNEQEARRQGVTAVVMSVVPVLDHFDLALSQKADSAAEGILAGVRVIRAELVRAIEKHGVRVIQPATNDPFDPTRHEAIMEQAAEGVDPGHISGTFQPGFELGDRLIRSAKVSVAPH